MPDFQIGARTISETTAPYVIAEIGVNHEGSMDLAKKLIELAHEGGAHAAKFQSYKADTLASKNSPAYWDTTKESTESQYKLFKKYDSFGADEYRSLAHHCSEVGIDFLSTPFDSDAVEYLAPIVPAFKVASADLTNLPLLRQVAACGKPVLLSTGAATLDEVDIAVDELVRWGADDVSLLHCVLNYPTPAENAHLGMIEGLIQVYPNRVIGYSDHTVPDEAMTSLTTAYLLGARILEKHFTHDKTLPGNDHYHAMDVADLARFTGRMRTIRELVGDQSTKAPAPSEDVARSNARRSIVVAKAISAGDVLDDVLLTTKRPGTGISPLHWDVVVGSRAARDLETDHVLEWSDVADGE